MPSYSQAWGQDKVAAEASGIVSRAGQCEDWCGPSGPAQSLLTSALLRHPTHTFSDFPAASVL